MIFENKYHADDLLTMCCTSLDVMCFQCLHHLEQLMLILLLNQLNLLTMLLTYQLIQLVIVVIICYTVSVCVQAWIWCLLYTGFV